MNHSVTALKLLLIPILSLTTFTAQAGTTVVVDPATVKFVPLTTNHGEFSKDTACEIVVGGTNFGYMMQGDCMKAQALAQKVPAKNLAITNLGPLVDDAASVSEDASAPVRGPTLADLQKQLAQLQSQLGACPGIQATGTKNKQVEDLISSVPVTAPDSGQKASHPILQNPPQGE
jgi:hypothetical protein